jgi:hypothetical protein
MINQEDVMSMKDILLARFIVKKEMNMLPLQANQIFCV